MATTTARRPPSSSQSRPAPGSSSTIHTVADVNSNQDCITRVHLHEELTRFAEVQARGIRYEFRKSREESDGQIEELGNCVDEKFEAYRTWADQRFRHVCGQIDDQGKRMDERFEIQGQRIEILSQRVDEQFEEQRKQLEEHRSLTDLRFDTVHTRFDEQRAWTERRFQKVDERFQTVSDHFEIMTAKQKNSTAIRLQCRICPIPHIDPTTGSLRQPLVDIFPRWVGVFWNLKRRRNWLKLIKLHEFYMTDGWETWGHQPFEVDDIGGLEDDDDGDDENGEENASLQPHHSSLADAVEFAPDIALGELAGHLGLNYNEISIQVAHRVLQDNQHGTSRQQSKRPTHADPEPGPLSKRQRSKVLARQSTLPKTSAPSQRERDPPFVDPSSPVTRLPLEDLIGNYEERKPSPPRSPSTTLGYGPIDQLSFERRLARFYKTERMIPICDGDTEPDDENDLPPADLKGESSAESKDQPPADPKDQPSVIPQQTSTPEMQSLLLAYLNKPLVNLTQSPSQKTAGKVLPKESFHQKAAAQPGNSPPYFPHAIPKPPPSNKSSTPNDIPDETNWAPTPDGEKPVKKSR